MKSTTGLHPPPARFILKIFAQYSVDIIRGLEVVGVRLKRGNNVAFNLVADFLRPLNGLWILKLVLTTSSPWRQL